MKAVRQPTELPAAHDHDHDLVEQFLQDSNYLPVQGESTAVVHLLHAAASHPPGPLTDAAPFG